MIELLNRFVANSGEPREYMRAPFTRGDWTYAMNGHIAVRAPKIDGMEILPDEHAPKLEGLFESVCPDACIALPPLPPQEECSMCNGTGIAYECEECDGDGEFEHMGRTPIRAKSATGLRRSNIAAESMLPADTATEQAKNG